MAKKRLKQAPIDRPRAAPDDGWVRDGVAIFAAAVYAKTPPYPVRGQESVASTLSVRSASLIPVTLESLYITGTAAGGTLQQVYFPVDFEHRIQTGDNYEALQVTGTCISGNLGQTYFPVDYTYRRDTSDDYEALSVTGTCIGGVLGQEYFPVDYENWPAEALTITGTCTGGSLT